MKRTALVSLFALLLGIFVPQASAGTTKQVEPLNQILPTCSGESVQVSGEILLIQHSSVDPSGVTHYSLEAHWRHVTGVTQSGITYHGILGDSEHYNRDVTGTYTIFTLAGSYVLISEGGAANLLATITFHVTITPDGSVVTVRNEHVVCVA